MSRANQVLLTQTSDDDWLEFDEPISSQQAAALSTVTQLLNAASNGGQLAKRHLEYRDGAKVLVISDEYHDAQAKRPQVVYVNESSEQDDKLTFFCFGLATSAIVVVATLVILTILHC